ncbi:MAG: RNA polymerase sigma factor [Ignavibacteria bacterium]|nr:RNA polymerase sigma factor [Ignavibacteria bacterium]
MKSQEAENFSKDEDFAIVQEILGGNINLFEKLQNKYKKPLSLLISRMVHNSEDVRDIVQETFIRAYTNLKYFKKEFSFHSWLFKIASNLCIDYLRKKRIQKISIEQPYSTGEDDRHFDYPDTESDTYNKIILSERNNALYQAIEMLPEHYRQVIILRHFEELDYQEISKRLSLPLGTVKVQLFRARKALLDILRGKKFEFGT